VTRPGGSTLNDRRLADIVFIRGGAYTVDAASRWAQAVAVRDGSIVAVGTDEQVLPLRGPDTRVVDLTGRMLLPGFQDAHVHTCGGGLDRLRCDLSATHSVSEYLDKIAGYAEANRDAPWILGSGWSMDQFPGGTPDRGLLDRLLPDRPVFLVNRDYHAAWANSRALQLAHIDQNTPDPDGGRIEREPDGGPQGTLHEGAMTLVRRFAPDAGADECEQGILNGQAHLHSLGITAWQEAIVGDYPTVPNSSEAFPELARRETLTGRVVGALFWDRSRGSEDIDAQVEELVAHRVSATVGMYSPTTVKIMLDGVCENFTARMIDPYLDASGAPSGNRGLSYVSSEDLPQIVTKLDAAGFQVHIHTIGDGAVRASLDAIEAARSNNGWTDNRHHLAHVQVAHPEDISRFRRLGVAATGQPLWAAYEPQMIELTLPFLGTERAAWQYPFGSLLRSGAVLAFGSDWPISTPDVMQGIHVAVNRTVPAGYLYGGGDPRESEPFLPEQRITLAQAIRAYTMGSAYVNHLDAVSGSIEVGKYADLAVVTRNLFALDPSQISSASVELTMVGGRVVYAAS
jgi:predicted amidohydrolase YtcJ